MMAQPLLLILATLNALSTLEHLAQLMEDILCQLALCHQALQEELDHGQYCGGSCGGDMQKLLRVAVVRTPPVPQPCILGPV